jgi:hypothetical protein
MNSNTENEFKTKVIDSEREYAIRKGKVLERFEEKFHERYKYNALYREVRELLIRDADPYAIIEKLIEINAEQMAQFQEMVQYVSPNYYLNKSKPS